MKQPRGTYKQLLSIWTGLYLCALTTQGGEAPTFNESTIKKDGVYENVFFSGSIAGEASTADGSPLHYMIYSGPEWLQLAPDGTLSGYGETVEWRDRRNWTVLAFNENGYDRMVLDMAVSGLAPVDRLETIAAIADSTGYADVELKGRCIYSGDHTWLHGDQVLGTGTQITTRLPIGEHLLTLQYHSDRFGTYLYDVTATVLEGPSGPLSVDAGPDINIIADMNGTALINLKARATGPYESVVWKRGPISISQTSEATFELPIGQHEFLARVRDAAGNMDTDYVQINVIAYPDLSKPTVEIIEPFESFTPLVIGGTASLFLEAEGIGDIEEYRWELNGKVAGYGPLFTAHLGYGNNTIIVTVTDSQGNTDQDILMKNGGAPPFQLTENPIIKPAATLNEPYSINLTDKIKSNYSYRYSIQSLSGPAWLKFNGFMGFSGTPGPADAGLNQWTIQIIDYDHDYLETATLQIEVIVPGMVYADEDQEVEAGPTGYATVALNAYATSDYIDIAWKEDGQRIGVGENIEINLAVGTHTLVARAKFAELPVARDTVIVTVNPGPQINTPPEFLKNTIKLKPARIKKGYKASVADQATDADGDPLTFSLIDGPTWLKVTSDGRLTGKPGKNDKGQNLFTIQVEDGKGGSAQATIKIRVK